MSGEEILDQPHAPVSGGDDLSKPVQTGTQPERDRDITIVEEQIARLSETPDGQRVLDRAVELGLDQPASTEEQEQSKLPEWIKTAPEQGGK